MTSSPDAAGGPAPVPFDFRMACGLLGILLAAIAAGLNNRVSGLVLADVRGALGFGSDAASWMNTAYSAGELAVMPFATWFAVTFSLRRFHLAMLFCVIALATVIPLVRDLTLLLALRVVQGFCAGALVPLLMMAALRFLPLPIRLHGLALYAMTATFAPNLALWIAALCVDRLEDWRWVYWHVIPLGLIAAALVRWGMPKLPPALPRLARGNWFGMALGLPGLALLVVGFDQGERLDWFNSPLIITALGSGTVLTALFLASEWLHPAPFMRLQLLGRRNLGLGFALFFCLVICMGTAVGLPANMLGHLQQFRMEQLSALGLIVALPQLLLGPLVALLLYQHWIDARHVFALGLLLIALACWWGSGITGEWMVAQLIGPQILTALGQAMAVVPLLFLSTSVVQPMEGPFVAGIINTLRAFGTVLGGSVIGAVTTLRTDFHREILLDQAARLLPGLPPAASGQALDQIIGAESAVLSTADVYLIFGIVALAMVPFVLSLQYIPAPALAAPPSPAPSSPASAASPSPL